MLDIISVVFADPEFFGCIPASAADATAVDPKGIKTLLGNGLATYFISGNRVFSNGLSNLPRNPPDCIGFDNWLFDNSISFDNHSQKLYEESKLVYQLVITDEEN